MAIADYEAIRKMVEELVAPELGAIKERLNALEHTMHQIHADMLKWSTSVLRK